MEGKHGRCLVLTRPEVRPVKIQEVFYSLLSFEIMSLLGTLTRDFLLKEFSSSKGLNSAPSYPGSLQKLHLWESLTPEKKNHSLFRGDGGLQVPAGVDPLCKPGRGSPTCLSSDLSCLPVSLLGFKFLVARRIQLI